MNTIPSMWRIELLHPALVHLPIAFLTFGTVLYVLACFQTTRRAFFLNCSLLMLVVGTLGAWAATWSGDQAHSIVNRVICDPTVTELHEVRAEQVTWLFTVLAPLALVVARRLARASWLIALGCIGGVAGLVYTAHLGASLVYQQGAAVYHPSPECREFE